MISPEHGPMSPDPALLSPPCSHSQPRRAQRALRLVRLQERFPRFSPRGLYIDSYRAAEISRVLSDPIVEAYLEAVDEWAIESGLEGASEPGGAASLLDPAGNNLPESTGGAPRAVIVDPSDVVNLSHRHGHHWVERWCTAQIVGCTLGERVGRRFLECGCYGRTEVKIDGGKPVAARILGSRCRSRACPQCQRAAADLMVPGIQRLVESWKWPMLLTLTLRHDPDDDLRPQIDALLLGWKRLRRRGCCRPISGGVRVIEVKRTDGGWHPHLHVLCDCRWLDRGEIAAAWSEVTGGSHVIDVRRIRGAAEAAAYVSKYVCKAPTFADPLDLAEWMLSVKGLRLAAAFGDAYGTPLRLDIDELPEEERADDGLWIPQPPVFELIRLASEGDRFAAAILELLTPGRWSWPPDPTPPPPPPTQANLFGP